MSTGNDSKAVAQIGVAGLGVMGRNLAANIESRNIKVAVWNRSYSKTEELLKIEKGTGFYAAKEPEEFIASIKRPRSVILMVTAGKGVDLTIDRLLPLLDEGDILIDGGNSWYEDSVRREILCKEKGIHFVGMGISGGELGARLGPSIMPGGTKYAYDAIKPVLEKIAAVTDSGSCVTHVGTGGAGHFVKMVHNGIEYADMQLIAEAYDILSRVAGKNAGELSKLFTRWNSGPLASFLIELTGEVLGVTDDKTGKPLVDMILDKAGQKGTGRWTAQAALNLGVPVPSIAAAVDARTLSSMKEQRINASKILDAPKIKNCPDNIEQMVENALLAAKIIAYAQGMYLIKSASKEFDWGVSLKEAARIWKGGCIIRASLLDDIMKAFENSDLVNLLLDSKFAKIVDDKIGDLRTLTGVAAQAGVPVPAFSASLNYFDAYRTPRLPQNLIQAQRDNFGAHTYQRTDDPDGPFVHTQWNK